MCNPKYPHIQSDLCSSEFNSKTAQKAVTNNACASYMCTTVLVRAVLEDLEKFQARACDTPLSARRNVFLQIRPHHKGGRLKHQQSLQCGKSPGLSWLRASRYLINQTDPGKQINTSHKKMVVIYDKYSTVFFSPHISAKYGTYICIVSLVIILL